MAARALKTRSILHVHVCTRRHGGTPLNTRSTSCTHIHLKYIQTKPSRPHGMCICNLLTRVQTHAHMCMHAGTHRHMHTCKHWHPPEKYQHKQTTKQTNPNLSPHHPGIVIRSMVVATMRVLRSSDTTLLPDLTTARRVVFCNHLRNVLLRHLHVCGE